MDKEEYTYTDLKLILENCFIESYIRALWLEYLNPSSNIAEFLTNVLKGREKLFYRKTGIHLNGMEISENSSKIGWSLVNAKKVTIEIDNKWMEDLHELNSIQEYFKFVLEKNSLIHDKFTKLINREIKLFLSRVNKLTPQLIESLKSISYEYMTWLKMHPKSISNISWEALEKITAEIFASQGFEVVLTGKQKGKSADVIAVKQDVFGIETKYLIECKKFDESRKIGLEVINGVIGAKTLQGVEHALLVTTSTFSNHIIQNKAIFQNLNINLKDGNDLIKWISNYKPRDDYGLWINPNLEFL